jgi:hypothetical protein
MLCASAPLREIDLPRRHKAHKEKIGFLRRCLRFSLVIAIICMCVIMNATGAEIEDMGQDYESDGGY